MKELKEKLKHYKVLFVDDEIEIRNATCLFLKKFFDTVLVCENGEDGLKIFKNNSDIKIVFTDLMMPKMDGISMIKEIRKISSDVEIVVVTGSDTQKDSYWNEINCKYIIKPITFNTLIEILKEIK